MESDSDDGAVRVGDGDRQAAVEQLGRACGEGRLSLGEFEERVESVYRAVTRSDLNAVSADLPGGAVVASALPPPRRRSAFTLSAFGMGERSVASRLPARITHVGLFGGTNLDLSDATVAGPDTSVTLVNILGSAHVRVPRRVNVDVSGISIAGSRAVSIDGETAPTGAPHVRLRVLTLFGSATVTRG